MIFPPYNNYFDNSTKKNYIKMMRVSTYYDLGLNEIRLTDADAAEIYAITHPKHLDYVIKYNLNRSAAGNVHGNVFTKDELAVQLNHTEISDWDVAFQAIHKKGTVQYETCWIGGHAAITRGEMPVRINNILLLTEAMTAYTELDALRAIIEAFYVLISSAQEGVVGKKSTKKAAPGNLEAARVANAKAMFQGFGLMLSFPWTNAQMNSIIDTETIQTKKPQMLFNNGIVEHRRDKIASRTLIPTDTIEVINDGTVDLKFFVLRFPEDAIGLFVTITAGETRTFAASLLGNIGLCRYVMVQNDSLTTAGHYSFRFID
jgi:hypothetical protein